MNQNDIIPNYSKEEIKRVEKAMIKNESLFKKDDLIKNKNIFDKKELGNYNKNNNKKD